MFMDFQIVGEDPARVPVGISFIGFDEGDPFGNQLVGTGLQFASALRAKLPVSHSRPLQRAISSPIWADGRRPVWPSHSSRSRTESAFEWEDGFDRATARPVLQCGCTRPPEHFPPEHRSGNSTTVRRNLPRLHIPRPFR